MRLGWLLFFFGRAIFPLDSVEPGLYSLPLTPTITRLSTTNPGSRRIA